MGTLTKYEYTINESTLYCSIKFAEKQLEREKDNEDNKEIKQKLKGKIDLLKGYIPLPIETIENALNNCQKSQKEHENKCSEKDSEGLDIPIPQYQSDNLTENVANKRPSSETDNSQTKGQTTKRLECEWKGCSTRIFCNEKDLYKHVNTEHVEKDNLLICQWEGCKRGEKPLATKQGLEKHMRPHTGEKS